MHIRVLLDNNYIKDHQTQDLALQNNRETGLREESGGDRLSWCRIGTKTAIA